METGMRARTCSVKPFYVVFIYMPPKMYYLFKKILNTVNSITSQIKSLH